MWGCSHSCCGSSACVLAVERGNYRHYGRWQTCALPSHSQPTLSSVNMKSSCLSAGTLVHAFLVATVYSSLISVMDSDIPSGIPRTSGLFVEPTGFGGAGGDSKKRPLKSNWLQPHKLKVLDVVNVVFGFHHREENTVWAPQHSLLDSVTFIRLTTCSSKVNKLHNMSIMYLVLFKTLSTSLFASGWCLSFLLGSF